MFNYSRVNCWKTVSFSQETMKTDSKCKHATAYNCKTMHNNAMCIPIFPLIWIPTHLSNWFIIAIQMYNVNITYKQPCPLMPTNYWHSLHLICSFQLLFKYNATKTLQNHCWNPGSPNPSPQFLFLFHVTLLVMKTTLKSHDYAIAFQKWG